MGTAKMDRADGDTAFSAQHVVHVVAGQIRGDGRPASAAAARAAEEMQAALMAQLEGNLGHVVLWEQFLRTPDDVFDAVVGVVATLIRQDPVLEGWLREAWARWQQAAGAGGARERRAEA